MCELNKRVHKKTAKGFKVVAEKDGKRYSLAMGFCYDDFPDGVPVVKGQKRLASSFSAYILRGRSSSFSLFSAKMQGRTSVFKRYKDAVDLYRSVKNDRIAPGYVVELYYCEVQCGVMSGIYRCFGTRGFDVVAGREIKFIEKMNVEED